MMPAEFIVMSKNQCKVFFDDGSGLKQIWEMRTSIDIICAGEIDPEIQRPYPSLME